MLQAIMITNGGPHPADKWAEMTSETIANLIQIKDDSISEEAKAARAAKRLLQTNLFNIFDLHHSKVQAAEEELKKAVTTAEHAISHADHAVTPLDVTPHMGTFDEVMAELMQTPFAAHFAKPEVAEVIRQIIGSHTSTVMNIERLHHRDQLVAKGA